jgi:hypothetical protein
VVENGSAEDGNSDTECMHYDSKVDPTIDVGKYSLTEEPSTSAVPVAELKYKGRTLQTRQQRRREKMREELQK